jgi:hypothetical protein
MPAIKVGDFLISHLEAGRGARFQVTRHPYPVGPAFATLLEAQRYAAQQVIGRPDALVWYSPDGCNLSPLPAN